MIKKIFLIIIAITITIAGIFAALFYTRTLNPSWNPFGELSPQAIISRAAAKMAKAKTFHMAFNSAINIQTFDTKGTTKENFNITLKNESDIDKSKKNAAKAINVFSATIGGKGINISFAGEERTLDNVYYFELTSLPPIVAGLGSLKGKWIKIDKEGIKKIIEATGKTYSPPSKQEVESLRKDLEKLVKGKQFIVLKEKLPDEKIGKIDTHHYLVSLNKTALSDFIMGMLKKENTDQKIIEEMPAQIDKFFKETGEIDFEIWIGKKDNLLYKVKGSKIAQGQLSQKQLQGTANIQIEFNFSRFNKKLKIEAPKEFKPIEEFL